MLDVSILAVGTGNLGSLSRMLQKIGANPVLVSTAAEVASAKRLILPGVGSFDAGMRRLEDAGVVPALGNLALTRGIPVLGVCLGMQMLLERSEEGERPGLGWIPGVSKRFCFAPDSALKVPHMGWSGLASRTDAPLLKDLPAGARFYFAHSYHAAGVPGEYIVATATHGCEFPCIVRRGNIHGVQFHPEKSHRYGLQLLRNFVSG
jgi:glutamine amidotransferase